MPGRSLAARSALASLVAVVALGLVLSVAVQRVLRGQAVAEATRSGELVASALQHSLDAGHFGRTLTLSERAALDRVAEDAAGLTSLRLWADGGRVLYDSAGDVEGTVQDVGPLLAGAYEGRTGAHLETEPDAEQPDGERALLEVYVPLRGADGEPYGVVELYLDHEDTAARAQHATLVVAALVAGGLTLLWAVLWWLSLPVSRALRRRADEQERLALTDPLTGLPNRRALLAEIAAQTATGRPVLLLLLDLDRFKEVNDTLGHHVGDLLLEQVGSRLSRLLGGRGTVGRLGGDEFAVVVPDVATEEEALALAGVVGSGFDEAFPLGDLQLDVDPSIGVALAPRHAREAAELLQRADVAMYVAKQRHTLAALYDVAYDVNSPDRLALLADLRDGLGAGELSLVYQPCFELQGDGACRSVEALVRWWSPKRGAVPPSEFIPLCERTGLVRVLTRFVLDEALRQLRAWEEEGLVLNMAVNLSASNLAEDDLPGVVRSLLERHGVPPARLVLEVTESAVITDPEGAAAVLRQLVALGVDIAIDDFGMGYSSMSRLLELPLAALKVDRSFVADLPAGPGAAIVQATTGLGHDLGLRVVAEGIETPEQLARAVEIGCDVGQGYLLARPVPAGEVAAAALRGLVPAQPRGPRG